MNIKYNCEYLRWILILSAVSFIAALFCYFFENGCIGCSYTIGRLAAVLFYVNGAMSLIMLEIVNIKRLILERRFRFIKKKKVTLPGKIFGMGIFRFFSSRHTISVDVLFFVLIGDLITSYILGISVVWYKDVLKMMIIWFFYMHSILNGKNYIFFMGLAEIGAESIKR